jgi:hypothetical protein
MSAERDAALSYCRRVLGMVPSVRAQLAVREQQVLLLTAEVEEARVERDDALRRLDAGVLDLARARGVHPDVIRVALGVGASPRQDAQAARGAPETGRCGSVDAGTAEGPGEGRGA